MAAFFLTERPLKQQVFPAVEPAKQQSTLPGTFSGTLEADLASGQVDAANASPVDTYTVSVRITDNCGAIAEQEFSLRVTVDQVFISGFENP